MTNKIDVVAEKPALSITFQGETFEILSKEDEIKLDNAIKNIEKYMAANDGKGESDEVKDKYYGEAQDLWHEYSALLKGTKYNFFMNRKEWMFLSDYILNKAEYDTNTVFLGLELSNSLGAHKELVSYTNDIDLQPMKVSATEITYIYHILAEFKPRGINKSATNFAAILKSIGDISKAFNYYNNEGERMSDAIQRWVYLFDPNVNVERNTDSQNDIQAEVVEETSDNTEA